MYRNRETLGKWHTKHMRKLGRQGSVTGRDAGSTIVEMAVALPLFLLLTVGIFEFGRAWLTVNTMNHAAREAVRLAVTIACLTADASTVIAKANDILATAGLTGATVSNTAPSGDPPAVTATIALNTTFMTGIGPLFGFSFAGSIPMTTSVTMRYERTTCPP